MGTPLSAKFTIRGARTFVYRARVYALSVGAMHVRAIKLLDLSWCGSWHSTNMHTGIRTVHAPDYQADWPSHFDVCKLQSRYMLVFVQCMCGVQHVWCSSVCLQ